ncbi:unnamed protein product [Rhodiola kirilowii]
METATVSPANVTASPAKWSGRKPHFIVNFMPNLSSERLEIPHKFNQHVDGRSNVWVLLSGNSGKVWRVGLVKRDESLFFNEGWSGFVRDNSLDFGDTLAFEYSGDWQFEVYIRLKGKIEYNETTTVSLFQVVFELSPDHTLYIEYML